MKILDRLSDCSLRRGVVVIRQQFISNLEKQILPVTIKDQKRQLSNTVRFPIHIHCLAYYITYW